MISQLEICFNTTGLMGRELRCREMRNGSQNARILDFFRQHPGELFTPYDIYLRLFTSSTPKVSIGRSITTLTRLGFLVKVEEIKKPGAYGEPNCTWRLKL